MFELTYTRTDTGETCTVTVTERGLRERLANVHVSKPVYRRLAADEMRAKVAAIVKAH